MSTYGNVIPGLRYNDAPAAIEFLTSAFGFVSRMVVPGDDGGIAHAQLTMGSGMVMLGSAVEGDPFSDLGASSIYVVVDDPDAHHAHAIAKGAEIILEPDSPDYGGRNYTARDPEGNYWSFGSYDPE